LKPPALSRRSFVRAVSAATAGLAVGSTLSGAEDAGQRRLKEIAGQLNVAGEQCKAAGLELAVHNHYQEFSDLEGKPIFDRLLEMTEPELVTVEMDLCWAVKGGADPVDYLRRYPKRIQMLHVKDLGPAPDYAMVPVGAGTIDFARIFAAAEADGVKYYIVELEGAASTMKAAEQSYRYLSQLTF